MYTVVSLFSGGLGLDVGMAETGRFHLRLCVEKEKSSCDTIRQNRSAGRLPDDLEVVEGDIRDLDPEELLNKVGLRPGDVDVLVGGPPCQSFSTAGKRGALQDPRGTLLWEFLRFVNVMQPKVFVMENVRGLLAAAVKPKSKRARLKGEPPLEPAEEPGSVVRAFAADLADLQGCSYHLDVFEVNAVNYGAPQIRERVLFFGNRYGATIDFPHPTHGPSLGKQLLPWATLGNAIGGLQEAEPVVLDFSPRKKHFLDMVPPGSNWRSLPPEVQEQSMGKAFFIKGGRAGWWRRLALDLPCPTLMTMPNHASTALCHPTETRALSVKEYARVQEFPDTWAFAGSTAEQYTQIGNAVPVRLGRIVGEVVARELDALSVRGWCPYTLEPRPFRLVYLNSHVRTRKWFKNGQAILHTRVREEAPSTGESCPDSGW